MSETDGILSLICNRETTWRGSDSFTPRPLYPRGKSPCYSMSGKLGGLQSLSGHSGDEKKTLSLFGNRSMI
jgi:hypothetical protein